MSVREELTLLDNVAVTVTLVKRAAAKARQISEVPLCTLVLLTRTHVKPAPATPVTVVFAPDKASVPTKASNNSFVEAVEKLGLTTVVAGADRSVNTFASMEIPVTAVAVKFTPVTFAPLTVTALLIGVNVKPVFDGVTV
jgi:hypothetical protein